MSFTRYPKYKDSGVELLGDVPEHWSVKRLKFLTRDPIQNGIGAPSDTADPELPRYIRITDIASSRSLHTDTFRSLPVELANTAIFTLGDILFACVGATFGKSYLHTLDIGPVCYAGYLVKFSPTAVTNPRYVSYWAESQHYWAQLNANVIQSTVQNFSASKFRELSLATPTYDEQARIADFLDFETAKIDELVVEQQRLMELLKVKRQTVISHAVTKGLNPKASLKPSGVEWLGEVPVHWEVSRIANVFREVAEEGLEELPILTVSIHHGVSDKEIDEEDMDRKVTRSDDRTKYKKVAPGDLVYNMMRAWQGGFGTVTVAGMVSPAYVVARPKRPLETAYIEHLLRTPQAIEQMRRHSRGVTDFRLRLYWDEFKNLRVTLPPRDEAIAICTKIAEMEEKFSAMSAACEDSIKLLQERRTALISAAVTGQIDVRNIERN